MSDLAALPQAATDLRKPAAVAERLGVHPGTLANWRTRGVGPKYIRCVGGVRYRVADVDAWLAQQEAGGEDRECA